MPGTRHDPLTRRRQRPRSGASVMALALAAPLAAGVVPAPPAAAPAPRVPAAQAQHPVPVHPVLAYPARRPRPVTWHLPAPAWPAGGQATVSLPGPGRGPAAARPGNVAMAAATPGAARAGLLPVTVGPPVRAAGARGAGAAAAGSARVQVTIAAHRAASAAGVSGVIFTLARAGSGRAARVHVSLDYAGFAYADGGGYAARLRLAELPACALTTPSRPACRAETPLPSANDTVRFRLGADVTIPAAGAGRPGSALVLAATTSASGSGGDYTASPLASSGTWSAGGSSGAFTYSYPITVPPVPGGLAPPVALRYDSQAVDGLTSSTSPQASWIGDGWNYQPGYIERDYQTCGQESGIPSADKTGDLCWSASNVTTLSLNGATTTLVDDPMAGWHAEADTGQKIQYVTRGSNCPSGTVNGTSDGGYWVITQPDGTSYYFGMSQLPGWASGDTSTASAWTVPVYSTASGQPCYNSTFSASHGPQAWRWNLDYVTDSHGDAITYYYGTETNYYAAGNPWNAAQTNTKATASYTQAGALQKIEYGLRAGAVYGVTPAAEVSFTTPQDRTDIPTGSAQDLACGSGATCTVISPSFWGKYRLSAIATQAVSGGALNPADSWALTQSYPPTGDTTPPSLWLNSIQRTGQDGAPVSPALPPVSFDGMNARLPNRVNLTTGYLPYTRLRIDKIVTETGAEIDVFYSAGTCPSPRPDADANTSLCYPDWWSPPNSAPMQDWFNKWVVTEVADKDKTGGQPAVDTFYCYGPSPGCLSGGAWHYNDDAVVRSQQRTWDQWRGFAAVTATTGAAPDPVTQVTDRYFQGMDGDYQTGGGTASAQLSATVGGVTITVPDSDQFAATSFEHVVYNGQGGGVVTDTVTTPWSSAATATQSQPTPLLPLKAYLTGTARTQTFTALASGGYRESDVSYGHDSRGRVTSAASVPDAYDNGQPGDAAQDTCTVTSYADNTSGANWLLDLPRQVTATAEPPAACPPSGSVAKAALVSDMAYFYDGATSVSADTPSAGDVTMTQQATAYDGTTETWTTESKAAYDQYGRVTSATDANSHTTLTSYSPAAGAEPATVTVTDPMGLATTTSYDPLRDLPVQVTTPAGQVTSETYDALGRLTAVWLPTASKAAGQAATYTYAYNPSATAPSSVTTSTIEPAGTSYLTSTTIYDSLLRPLETQAETPDGNRDITDTFYNSDGLPSVIHHAYYATGLPSGTLDTANDSSVPDQTGYTYDGAGRVIKNITFYKAQPQFETDTAYGGDYTTVTPPAGGTAQTTYTDGRGLTSYIYQYHSSPPPASPPAPGSGSQTGSSGWDQTGYAYDAAGRLTGITDAAGNTWAFTYDLAGNKTSSTSPDTGTTGMTYDPAGNLLSTTDARTKTISFTYDRDNRKTAEYDTTGGAAQTGASELASWTWDTLAKGMLTQAVAYTNGTTGTSYTQQALGYTSAGQSKGTQTTISAGPLAGTYTTEDYYAPAGQLDQYVDSGAGGLPGEIVNIGYDGAGQPTDITSSIGSYVPGLSYTVLGQPLEYTLGSSTAPAYLADYYDYLGRLTEAKTITGVTPVTVSDINYGYDNADDVTSQGDTVTGDYQCYHYDWAGRLADAWSQGSSGCPATPPTASLLGGPAPYWQHLAYDTAGNITTSNWTYNNTGSNYVTQASSYAPGQPHTLTSQNVVSSAYGYWTNHDSYDVAGNLTNLQSAGYQQQLTWNDQGKLAGVSDNQGNTTSNVYDAFGNLLLQTDDTTVTLYLPDEQIVQATSNGTTTVTGTRYYTLGGVTIARSSSGQVQYLTGDQHGTSMTAIDSASLAVTRRYYTPFGGLRWPYPGSWPGNKGFAGGTTDAVTALTNLGAREYNPGAGTFTSPDPVLTPYNPQDLNPYAYASDNPATSSDPTGLCQDASTGQQCPITGPPGSATSCPNTTPGCPGYIGPDPSVGTSGGRTSPAPAGGSSTSTSGWIRPRTPGFSPPMASITRAIFAEAATGDNSKADCLGPEEPSDCQNGQNLLGALYDKNSGGRFDWLKRTIAGGMVVGRLIGGVGPDHPEVPDIPEQVQVEEGTGEEGIRGGGVKGPSEKEPTGGENDSVPIPLLPGINPLINYTTIEAPLLRGIHPPINYTTIEAPLLPGIYPPINYNTTIDPGWSWLTRY